MLVFAFCPIHPRRVIRVNRVAAVANIGLAIVGIIDGTVVAAVADVSVPP